MFAELSTHLAASIIYDFSKSIGKTISKKEIVQTALKKLGIYHHLYDFPERYIEALVELRLQKRTSFILAFLREESIMQVFYDFYYGSLKKRGKEDVLKKEIHHCIETLNVCEDLTKKKVDIEREVYHFWEVFKQKVQESRTLNDVELIQVLYELKALNIDTNEKMKKFKDWMNSNNKETIQFDKKIFKLDNIDMKLFKKMFDFNIQAAKKIYNIHHIEKADFS